MSALATLRPHQDFGLDGLRQVLLSGCKRPVLQAPTGAGKTVLICHIVAGYRRRNKRAVICVHTLGLVDQTFDRLVENGFDPADIGVMQADHPLRRAHAPIQIATLQTLSRRNRPACDVVIVDECHVRHKVVDQWMADEPALTFIGFSATPWARGMARSWDCLVKSATTAELIGLGYLSRYRVWAPSAPDLSGVGMARGDYHEGQLAAATNKPQLVADIVKTYCERAKGLSALCFAANRAHAKMLHDQFQAADISAAYVDKDTPRSERETIGRQLAAGEIEVVVNIGTLTTGIDWDVRCIILARPTKSKILFVQMVGRGLRTAPGKTDCIILDHSDTHQRLGFVTDIDQDELDKGQTTPQRKRETEKSALLPKCCTACMALVPVGERQCPECGHEMPRPIKIATVDGELVEMGPNGTRDPRRRKTHALSSRPKGEVYGELLFVQRARGRSQGWLSHTFRDIFGCWPRGMEAVRPRAPSPELESFVKHKDIAFARSRQRMEVTHGAA